MIYKHVDYSQIYFTILLFAVDPKLSNEFEHAMYELGRLLKSEGMAYWELYQDPTDTSHYIEIRIADTWTDHLRQDEYVTKNIQVMENSIRELIKNCPQPNSLLSSLQYIWVYSRN